MLSELGGQRVLTDGHTALLDTVHIFGSRSPSDKDKFQNTRVSGLLSQ